MIISNNVQQSYRRRQNFSYGNKSNTLNLEYNEEIKRIWAETNSYLALRHNSCLSNGRTRRWMDPRGGWTRRCWKLLTSAHLLKAFCSPRRASCGRDRSHFLSARVTRPISGRAWPPTPRLQRLRVQRIAPPLHKPTGVLPLGVWILDSEIKKTCKIQDSG